LFFCLKINRQVPILLLNRNIFYNWISGSNTRFDIRVFFFVNFTGFLFQIDGSSGAGKPAESGARPGVGETVKIGN